MHGLASLKALQQLGTPAVGYETAFDVGGSWHTPQDDYPWEEAVGAAPISSFPDFPLPDTLPREIDGDEALSYLDRYADHFGLREQVRFGHRVIDIEEVDDEDLLAVTSRDVVTGEITTDYFSGVVLATGHSRYGDTLQYPGMAQFTRPIIPAGRFRANAAPGARVLVIGAAGAPVAASVAAGGGTAWLATAAATDGADDRNALLGVLPQPLLRVVSTGAHMLPWVSSRPESVAPPGDETSGVLPKTTVDRFNETSVWFADGSRIDPDLVVIAAGYLAGFPYVEDELLNVVDGQPLLARNIFTPRHPGLVVSGWLPSGNGDCALAHWQSMLIARYARRLRVAPRRALSFHRGVCRELPERSPETPSRKSLLRQYAADRDRLER